MDRRSFVGLAALGAAGLAGCGRRPRVRPAHGPNVLFIAIDDLNDWVGCLGGHPDTQTPNIDALAARGVLFTNAHCAAPLCNPSRASVLTGLRPSSSGVYDNWQPFRQAVPQAVTLPQHLRANGYYTLGGGKVFHRYPDLPSWAEYFPSMRRTKPRDPLPRHRPLNGIQGVQAHLDWGPIDVPEEEMGDWQVTEWARKALGKSYGRPFFLACGLYRPHLPWYAPRKYFDRFPLDSIRLPKVNEYDLDDVPAAARRLALAGGDHARIVATDNWRRAVQGYLACVAFADACVGRVLEALEASPYRDETAIVLWSDHGWHLGPKLHWRKWTLWEEATRNPLIVAAPGVTQDGGRCARAVSLLDLYPTLVDLCGVPPVGAPEGVSLLPLLRNPEAERRTPAVTTCGRGNHSVRSERWRYTRYHDGTEELYDHARDPLEWTNLAARPQYAPVKAEHAQWLPSTDAPPSPHEKGHENGGTETE